MNEIKDISWNEFLAEKKIRLSDINENSNRSKVEFHELIHELRDKKSIESIKHYCNRIESYEYEHGGLTKEQYLAHPYRVAILVLEQFPNVHDDYIKLALCHNIAEVSKITPSMREELGAEIIRHVLNLTVDRKTQWDFEYKKRFYKLIGKEKITRVIKVFDKLDNLYVLSENSNKQIKKKYLEEIKNNLLPFVIKDMPMLKRKFESMILYNLELM
jgi:(p)ppGpp synthase/HD superfamily hydrolase